MVKQSIRASVNEGRRVKKYKLTDETINHNGRTLHRIVALKDFGDVKKGEEGGFIEKEENLSHDGDCWVSGNVKVYGNAMVYGDARVSGKARVSENAKVSGNAWVYGIAMVYGNAKVYGDARVYGNAMVFGNARVYGNIHLNYDFWYNNDKLDMMRTPLYQALMKDVE